MNWDKATIGLLIRSIYDGRVDPANLPYKLYKAIAYYLTKGVFKGFGKDIADTVSDSVDHELLYNLRENVHIFSGAKTFNYVLETTNLIVEGDEILPLREFKKRALEIYDKYNVNWLDAEYETCIGQAQNATKWKDIETSPFDLVKYLAVIDENTSPVCVQYNGIIKDKKDPFWNDAAPLNHYRCFLPETLILTSTGWKRIDSINEGDIVIGGSGKERNVDFVHVNSFKGELTEIKIKKQSSSSTKEHRYLTIKGFYKAENINSYDILVQNIEVGFLNKIICTINNMIVVATYLLMPIIAKWESAMINAFDYYFKFRNKYIGKSSIDRLIANTRNSFFGKVIKNTLFVIREFLVVYNVFCRVLFIKLSNSIPRLYSGFMVKHRVVSFHSNNRIRSLFAERWRIRKRLYNIFKSIGRKYSPVISIYPLRFNSLTSFSWFKTVFSKKPHKGSVIDIPSRANLSVGKEFDKVEIKEGFVDGAPLDSFNSLFSFQLHSFWHRKLVLVKSKANIQYNGNVYNLSVDKDESYITNVGVVHNCRCLLQSVPDGIVSKKTINDFEIQPAPTFRNNAGQTGEVFTKEHPYFTDIPTKYRKLAKQNWGLPLPK